MMRTLIPLTHQTRLQMINQHALILMISLASLALSACHDQEEPKEVASAKSNFTAIARGKVDVEGGLLDVIAPENAVFSQVDVHVGDAVKRGQPLAELDKQAEELELAQAKATLEQAKAQQNLQTIHLPATTVAAKRWQKAAALGIAQQQQADDATQAQQQAEAENSIAAAAVLIAEQKVREAAYQLQKRTIRSPQDAEVIKVSVQQGSILTSEQRVAFSLLPKHPIVIRAEVNESFISRIKMGMKAGLLPDSSSTSSTVPPIAAHVTQIGKIYEPAHLNSDAIQQNNRVIICVLALDTPTQQQAQHLLIGQNVLVKFYD